MHLPDTLNERECFNHVVSMHPSSFSVECLLLMTLYNRLIYDAEYKVHADLQWKMKDNTFKILQHLELVSFDHTIMEAMQAAVEKTNETDTVEELKKMLVSNKCVLVGVGGCK
jgi:hypothetical protein